MKHIINGLPPKYTDVSSSIADSPLVTYRDGAYFQLENFTIEFVRFYLTLEKILYGSQYPSFIELSR